MIGNKKIFTLNCQGGRNYNEDSVYPLPGGAAGSVFLVCDGVGGSNRGEIASRMTCDLLAGSFDESEPGRVNGEVVRDYVADVIKKLNAYESAHPEAQGMATTLTLSLLKENSVLVAWCGDSRIYHIRDGQVLFKSRDHSLVANLVASGEITEEEAAGHPQKNVIFRAISAEANASEVETAELENIEDGDYLLLCSDGLLENVNAETIRQFFTFQNRNLNFTDEINRLCEGKTADNYSMQLLILERVKKRKSIRDWFRFGKKKQATEITGF